MTRTQPTEAEQCPCNSGWVCEEHPDQPWEHDGCGAAGDRCDNPGCHKDPNSIFAEIHCSTEDEYVKLD